MLALDHTVQILLLTVGGMLTVNLVAHGYAPRSFARRLTTGLLGLLAVLSVLAYVNFGRFHDYGRFGHHTYHYHDLYHYAFGAKYFRELGYYRLYDATFVGLSELGEEGERDTPARTVPTVRSLESVFTVKPAAELLREAPALRARFTPARWEAFRRDLATWLDIGWEPRWWRTMLFDLGFNPPPSWVVVAGPLANAIPFTPTSLELLPLIDLTLVLGLGAWLVYRAFGIAPAFAFVILFGNNTFASYAWTGGSFCRQLWLLLLTGGVAALRLERPRWAGALLGGATALRIFPALFLLGGGVALGVEALRARRRWRPLIEYLAAAAAVAGLLVAVSLLRFGPGPWRDFFAKLSEHNQIYWVMHLGFPRLAVWAPGIERQDFWFEPGLVRFAAWQERLTAIRAAREPWVTVVQGVAVLGGLAVATRLRPWRAALVAGGTWLFFGSMPANYYYLYLALFPAVCFEREARPSDAVRVGLPFALLVFFGLVPLAARDEIVQNALLTAAVAAFFVLLLASGAWDERGGLTAWWRRARRSPPGPAVPGPA